MTAITPEGPTDAELVALALGGSEDGFRSLVARYQRPVFGLIVRMVRNRELAEDLSQEVFLKAFGALRGYDPGRRFSSWLFKIAHNATIDHLRRGSLQTVSLSGSGEESGGLGDFLEDPQVRPPDQGIERADLAKTLEDAVARLGPAYREVILLRHREELSYQEIAEITGSSLGAVKTNLHRARKQLAEILEALSSPPAATR